MSNALRILLAGALAGLLASPPALALQQLPAGWSNSQPVNQPQQQLQLAQQHQFAVPLQRNPIAADLQNQVNALSAQLAAANRQLEYFQQQLGQQQQAAAPSQLAGAQHQAAGATLQAQPLQPLAQLQQYQQAQQAQQLHQAQQFLIQQQQQQQQQLQAQVAQPEQPRVSTLVDEPATSGEEAHFASQPRFLSRPEATTSSPASPASIEPSFTGQQQQLPAPLPVAQAPPANMAPPHNPARNDDKFSIGLGVLSPGYTQKFGNTALDFNQDKNGFSFTLSNNGHNNQAPQAPKPAAGASR